LDQSFGCAGTRLLVGKCDFGAAFAGNPMLAIKVASTGHCSSSASLTRSPRREWMSIATPLGS
jgi:hypothetical protein